MTTRVSAQLVAFLGAELQIVDQGGKVSNVFLQTLESFASPEASVRLLANPDFVVDGINSQEFFTLRNTLEGRGLDEKIAKTLAVLLIDAGKVLRKSPFELLQFVNGQRLNFDVQAFAAMNRLRPPSSQLGIFRPINNRRSLKSRSILA